jgi:cyclic pyranopterin phosphate synthase
MLEDTRGRPLRDLRISVTDRCNFRCRYCMPREIFGRNYEFLPRDDLLTFEEITRLVTIGAGLGVRKVRLTGGEPLLRHDLPDLVAMLAGVEGIEELTMTSNGSLLARHAAELKKAGLDRVTVSIDSLDEGRHTAISDSPVPLSAVLEGITAATEAGLTPVKLNMVVKRGVNDGDVVMVARHFKDTGNIIRFIEYMDVGHSNGWRLDDVVPGAEIVAAISAEIPLEPADAAYRGEVARRFRFKDGTGEVGVIASVTEPFCGDCTRARLSADGALYTCLFATGGHDLRALLRDDTDDAGIETVLRAIWEARDDRYSELRSAATTGLPKVEMSYIGG